MNPVASLTSRSLALAVVLALGPLAHAGSGPAEAASAKGGKPRPYRIYDSPKGASLRIRYAPPSAEVDRVDRSILRESPKAASNRVPRVIGVPAAPDRMNRELLAESPKEASNRVPRIAGASPDRLHRSPLEHPPVVGVAKGGGAGVHSVEARR